MASTSLPPGIPFILRGLALLFLAPFTLISLDRISNLLLGFTLPLWILFSACLLSNPIALAIYVWVRDWRYAREAAAQGAVTVPQWHGSLPGNLDIMTRFSYAFRNGYPGKSQLAGELPLHWPLLVLVPGDGQWDTFNRLGHVFDLVLFWRHTVVTIYPEHVKVLLCIRFTMRRLTNCSCLDYFSHCIRQPWKRYLVYLSVTACVDCCQAPCSMECWVPYSEQEYSTRMVRQEFYCVRDVSHTIYRRNVEVRIPWTSLSRVDG